MQLVESLNAKTSPTISCIYLHMLPVAEIETLEVPPFSPSSKEVLSQAVQASFAGFSQERSKHHFPHGRATHWPNTVDLLSAGGAVIRRPTSVPRCVQILCCGLSGRWTTGWTGARGSLASTAWAPHWKVWMGRSSSAWAGRLSRAGSLTALHRRSSGSTWRTWEEVTMQSILPHIQADGLWLVLDQHAGPTWTLMSVHDKPASREFSFQESILSRKLKAWLCVRSPLILKLATTASEIFLRSVDLSWGAVSSRDKVRSD